MAEAMGFELMDLLQSTVFKSFNNSLNFNELWVAVFRFDSSERPLTAKSGRRQATAVGQQ